MEATGGFAAFYRRIVEEQSESAANLMGGSRTLNIFFHKDYFTLHGDDAMFVADTFFKTRSVLKSGGQGEALPSVSVSNARLTAILRDVLIARRWTVVVWHRHGGTWTKLLSGSLANLSAFEPIVSIQELMRPDDQSSAFVLDDVYRGADDTGMMGTTGGAGSARGQSTGTAAMTMPPVGQQHIASAVMAIRLMENEVGAPKLGVASIDLNQNWLAVAEFDDDQVLSSFASFLTQYPALKCYCAADVASANQSLLTPSNSSPGFFNDVMAVVRRRLAGGAEVVELNKATTNAALGQTQYVLSDSPILRILTPQTKEPVAKFFDSADNSSLALDALAILVSQLQFALGDLAAETFTGHVVNLNKFMKLDQAALVALNIFPGPQDTNKQMSLEGLLGITRTNAGARRLRQWLRQPLLDLNEISQRHDVVEALVNSSKLLQGVTGGLRALPDVERHCKKIIKASQDVALSDKANASSLIDIVGMYQFATRLPEIINAMREAAFEDTDGDSMTHELKSATDAPADTCAGRMWRLFGEPLLAHSSQLQQFEEMVRKTIDLTPTPTHEYMILSTYNEELAELDARRRAQERLAEKVRAQVAQDLNLEDKKVKLNYAGHLGYHLRISRKDEKNLRGNKSYATLETRKDGVRFTNAKMRDIAAEHKEVIAEYQQTQAKIVAEAVATAVTYVTQLELAASLLADLDVLCAFAMASMASSTPYIRPILYPLESTLETGAGAGAGGRTPGIRLVAARHPCLEVQSGVSFVPNDIELVKGKSNVQIITGPNMGGKSTYIRTAGVIAVMAQIGCFVPCDEAEMNIVSSVLARVGAGDSQLKGVSTFKKEMLEAAAILRASNSDSLIIIDELGRGTSTYDGFGLAWAIAEYIATKVCGYALFATHFHELTSLSGVLPNVVNKHVTAHTGHGTITMLYRLRDGPCDRSFGIHVAELANFPPSVVQRAREKAQELESFGTESKVLMEELKRGSMANHTHSNDLNRGRGGSAEEDGNTMDVVVASSPVEGQGASLTQEQLQFLQEFAEMDFASVDPSALLEKVQAVLQE